ncbi:uncharacterized protein LOC128296621 [Gossypium arboreum]|uniref:uncharacterized protein LOC128296621 n=1 Tax=Gossypium arboreum TaxID=29729 RepID=UPI0022F18551|nr:uncharacterized protein LOC128296621 [Gossypium arboreum]
MGQSELGFLLRGRSLVQIVGDITWVSVGRRLGRVSDIGVWSIKLRIVLRDLFRCKLQSRVMCFSSHRETVVRLEVEMAWGEVVEHLAEVLSIRIDKLFRNLLLEVQGVIFPVDLMELPFGEFDLILGTDWLVKYVASLDCTAKRMVLKIAEDEKVVVIGERRDYLSNDFPDAFPDELLGLPPSYEVEFGIELLPGKAPVSITPYRIAPKELVELKAQIQELLDRGFI